MAKPDCLKEENMKTYTITTVIVTKDALFEKWQVKAFSKGDAKRKFYEKEPLYLGKSPVEIEKLHIIDIQEI